MLLPLTPARWVNLALILTYLVLAGLYAADHAWPKVLYWLGAALLSLGILLA